MASGQVAIPTIVGLGVVVDSVLQMLSLCGVCSTDHVARLYTHTTRPRNRAWEVLDHLRRNDFIESHRPAFNRPNVHRFTKRIRQKYEKKLIRWNSHLDHKLAITDVYMDLGRPLEFYTEIDVQFYWRNRKWGLRPDIYVDGMFIEVQRTPITSCRWEQKRNQYQAYFLSGVWKQEFDVQPKVIVVTNQSPSTVGDGIGYDIEVVKSITELKPPQ